MDHAAFLADLTAAAQTAWPEVTVIWRVQEIERFNWNNIIEKFEQGGTGMQPPYVVIQLGANVPDPEYHVMDADAYRTTAVIYYIRKTDVVDVTAELEASLNAFRLEINSGAYEHLDVVRDAPVLDASEMNPANVRFYAATVPLQAGSITIPLLMPDTETRS